MDKNLNIRFATIGDLPVIVDIYNQAIRSRCATGDINEFSLEERTEWFSKFDETSYPIYVAEKMSKVLGYLTLSPYRPGRLAFKDVAEISFFIDEQFQRNGIGSALVEFAMNDCSRINKKVLIAILLDINTASVKLCQKFDFTQWGHFPEIANIDENTYGQFVYGKRIEQK